MERSATKDYLQNCDEKIVISALRMGLDAECYYTYVCEIYRSLENDSGVRRKYKKMSDDAYDSMMAEYIRKQGVWNTEYQDHYRREFSLMRDLLEYISKEAHDDETRNLARAQLRFMLVQLRRQKRYLDAILYHTPSHTLFTDDSNADLANVIRENEDMLHRVNRVMKEF